MGNFIYSDDYISLSISVARVGVEVRVDLEKIFYKKNQYVSSFENSLI
jgi:hypothetical protein